MKVFVTTAMLLSFAIANAQAIAAPAAHKLPLDHGPRATSTPWLNKLARERQAAQRVQPSIADKQH